MGNKELGQRIAARRKQLHMTQEELAMWLGYKSKSTINKIELGINDIPEAKLKKFADVLDMPVEELLGLDGKEEPKMTGLEAELIEAFRRLPEDNRQLVLEMIKAATKNI